MRFAGMLLFVLIATRVFAQLPEGVTSRFSPLQGYVVERDGERIFVDLTKEAGLFVGDRLRVERDGKHLIHPVSGKDLGVAAEVVGQIEVVVAGGGFSEGRSAEHALIQAGDRVVRYQGADAYFISAKADAFALYQEVIVAMPHLNWHPLTPGEPADASGGVFFRWDGERLQITGPAHSPVFGEYQFASERRPEPPGGESIEAAGQISLEGEGVSLTVLRRGGGKSLGILAQKKQLVVLQAQDGRIAPLAEVGDLEGTLQWVDRFDQDGDGIDELLITSTEGEGVVSRLYRLEEDNRLVLLKRFPYFVEPVQLPEGRVLVGQEVGLKADGFGQPFPVEPAGDSLPYLASRLYSSSQGGSTGFELRSDDALRVRNAQGEILWNGSTEYGGSLRYFEYEAVGDGRDLETFRLFLGVRMLSPADGVLNIVDNEGSRVFKRSPRYTSGRVVALRWNGFAVEELWSTPPVDAYVADFVYWDTDLDGDDELITLHAHPSSWGRVGKSLLTVFSIQ